MNWFDWVDRGVSAVFIMLCWVLAHQYAARPGAMSKIVATGFGFAGLCVLGSNLLREVPQYHWMLPIAAHGVRIALIMALGGLVIRSEQIRSEK